MKEVLISSLEDGQSHELKIKGSIGSEKSETQNFKYNTST